MGQVHIQQKKQPEALHRNALRPLVAYHVVEVPPPSDDKWAQARVISYLDVEDVIIAFEGHNAIFNATKGRLIYPHQAACEWRDYKFRRARYVQSIQLTFDPDED